MKMSVFFTKVPATWTAKIPNESVKIFVKALRAFKIKPTSIKEYKNGMCDVEFQSVCNSLLRIGTFYGKLVAEESLKDRTKKINH
jgi:hypothetical protein